MSLATTVPRKTAQRLAQPATRYWKGKAPKGAAEVQSDSDEDEEGGEEDQEQEDIPIGEGDDEEDEGMTIRDDVRKNKASINIALKDVAVSKDGKVIVAGREESGRTALEEEEEGEDEEESEEGDEAEEESSSEEESSEEEKPKLQFRPVFVPKRARATIAEREQLVQDTDEAQRKKDEEAEERRKQSHMLVAESIRRELAEKEKEDDIPDVDDTDGLDPEGEFEAWRLRELARIKKEKEEEVAREQEREEIERRRAMPEEQRLKEDLERANKLREEKPKGQQKFLQKYWHKGAFHQDFDVLKRHDFTEATESTVDVSMLPKVMQVKNFGKRGRTKYTHLLDQDTTTKVGGFGGGGSVAAGGTGTDGGGCFNCGGPHLKKDCPQLKDQPSGANARPIGDGRGGWPDRGSRSGPSSRHADDRERDRDRDRSRRYDRGDHRGHERDSYSSRPRYDRSRSRSPYRSSGYSEKRHHSSGRYRSRSRDRSREKRRRVD